jgi:hypothetical protein
MDPDSIRNRNVVSVLCQQHHSPKAAGGDRIPNLAFHRYSVSNGNLTDPCAAQPVFCIIGLASALLVDVVLRHVRIPPSPVLDRSSTLRKRRQISFPQQSHALAVLHRSEAFHGDLDLSHDSPESVRIHQNPSGCIAGVCGNASEAQCSQGAVLSEAELGAQRDHTATEYYGAQ